MEESNIYEDDTDWSSFDEEYPNETEEERTVVNHVDDTSFEDETGFKDIESFYALDFLKNQVFDFEDFDNNNQFDEIYEYGKTHQNSEIQERYSQIQKNRANVMAKPYESWISHASKISNIPYETLASLIYTESRFNTNAVSKKGAEGLGQFMPETAKEYGINPRDPKQSIYATAKKLKGLLSRYNGDYNLALMAYNYGEGNLKKFLKGKKDLPDETRNYVTSVLSNSELFKKSQYGSLSIDVLMKNNDSEKNYLEHEKAQNGFAKFISGIDWDKIGKTSMDVLKNIDSFMNENIENLDNNLDMINSFAQNLKSNANSREEYQKFLESFQNYSTNSYQQNTKPIII